MINKLKFNQTKPKMTKKTITKEYFFIKTAHVLSKYDQIIKMQRVIIKNNYTFKVITNSNEVPVTLNLDEPLNTEEINIFKKN